MLCGWIALAAASLLRDSPASMLSGSFGGHYDMTNGDDVSMIMSEHSVLFDVNDGETLRPGTESDEERSNFIAEMGDLHDSSSGAEGVTPEMLDLFRERAEQDRQQDKYDPVARWKQDESLLRPDSDIDVTQDMLDNLEEHGALRPGSASVRDSASAGSRPAVRTESKPSFFSNNAQGFFADAPGFRSDVTEASVSPTGVVKKEVAEAQACGWTTTSPDGNSPGRVDGSCVAEGACPTDGRLAWPRGRHPTCTRDTAKSFCCETDGNYNKRKEAVRAWEAVDARIKAARKELGMGTQCYFSMNFQNVCSDGNTCTCMAKSACAGASVDRHKVCGESESTCCQDTGEDKRRLEEVIQRLASLRY